MKRKYRITICLVIATISGVVAGEISGERAWYGWFNWIASGTCFLVWEALFLSFCRKP